VDGLTYNTPMSLHTTKFSKDDVPVCAPRSSYKVSVVHDDMFKLVKKLIRLYPDKKVLFHNFANNDKPCAGIIKGGSQEVQLFRRSNISQSLTPDLYPISPGIILSQNVSHGGVKFDVATIATLCHPKKKEVGRDDNGNDNDLIFEEFADPIEAKETEARMKLLLKLATNYDIFLTGAWGCGVFGNPIYGLCKMWNRLLKKYRIETTIFCTYSDTEYDHFNNFISDAMTACDISTNVSGL